MVQQIPIDPDARAGIEIPNEGVLEVAWDVAYRRLALVNIIMVGQPASGDWVLIDAGLPGTADIIAGVAEARFGDAPPAAILLTHGHFDHTGALRSLLERWDVPVYAHKLELPYLDGTTAYPPPDPTVGGGVLSFISPIYPRGPLDVSPWLRAYASDGSVPHLPDWRWVHTPGHSVGHVSFWRENDKTLIAGDVFVTTAQESAYAVVVQEPEIHGPPMYFTQDWQASKRSVERLAALKPEVVVTGHGRAMRGEKMRQGLEQLSRLFDIVAVPRQGKYVDEPVTVQDGTAYPGR